MAMNGPIKSVLESSSVEDSHPLLLCSSSSQVRCWSHAHSSHFLSLEVSLLLPLFHALFFLLRNPWRLKLHICVTRRRFDWNACLPILKALCLGLSEENPSKPTRKEQVGRSPIVTESPHRPRDGIHEGNWQKWHYFQLQF